VVVGRYAQGGATAPAPPDDLIGADEAQAAAAEAIGAADTVPLDEKTIRDIFGGDEEDPEGE
jgi:hypothetical protein